MKSYDIEIDFVNWKVYEKNSDNARVRYAKGEKEREKDAWLRYGDFNIQEYKIV